MMEMFIATRMSSDLHVLQVNIENLIPQRGEYSALDAGEH